MSVLDSFKLTNKTAVVTGGARGLGRQHAMALAEAGANTAICDLLTEEGEKTRQELESLGVRSIFGRVDVRAPQEIDNFFARVQQEFGGIDILVNNAARPSEGIPLEQVPDELWHDIIDTNLSSLFYVGKRAALQMMERKHGVIINMASINASVISNIAPRHNVAYCVAKGGVALLTKGMAAEWAPHGIRVNAIAAGYVLTDQTAASAKNPEILARNLAPNTPQRAIRQPRRTEGNDRLPCFRRFVVHDGQHCLCRWRLHDMVTTQVAAKTYSNYINGGWVTSDGKAVLQNIVQPIATGNFMRYRTRVHPTSPELWMRLRPHSRHGVVRLLRSGRGCSKTSFSRCGSRRRPSSGRSLWKMERLFANHERSFSPRSKRRNSSRRAAGWAGSICAGASGRQLLFNPRTAWRRHIDNAVELPPEQWRAASFSRRSWREIAVC